MEKRRAPCRGVHPRDEGGSGAIRSRKRFHNRPLRLGKTEQCRSRATTGAAGRGTPAQGLPGWTLGSLLFAAAVVFRLPATSHGRLRRCGSEQSLCGNEAPEAQHDRSDRAAQTEMACAQHALALGSRHTSAIVNQKALSGCKTTSDGPTGVHQGSWERGAPLRNNAEHTAGTGAGPHRASDSPRCRRAWRIYRNRVSGCLALSN